MSNKLMNFINEQLPEALKVKLKEIVAEVKAEDTPAPAESKTYSEAPLQDGTVLKYTGEKLDVGSEVIIVTPEGEVPAPEGELVLGDGSILVIAKQGELSVVAEVKPAAEMKTETPATPAAFEAIQAELSAFKAEVLKEMADLKSENEKLKLKASKMAAQFKDTVLVVDAIANVPTDVPAVKPTNVAENKALKMLEYLASKNK